MIPVTILTGFLGSGKTTLLKRILNEKHGMKIAVIENEIGEENIDNDILVSDTQEQIIQLSNGCVCCTIREDLRTTLSDLAASKRRIAHRANQVIDRFHLRQVERIEWYQLVAEAIVHNAFFGAFVLRMISHSHLVRANECRFAAPQQEAKEV